MLGNAVVIRVRLTPGGVDEYGDPVTSTETLATIAGCAVAPRSSSDITERGRAGVIVGLSLYAPHGTDIRHDDLFDIDGTRYESDGEEGTWESPFSGWAAGVELALRRAVG